MRKVKNERYVLISVCKSCEAEYNHLAWLKKRDSESHKAFKRERARVYAKKHIKAIRERDRERAKDPVRQAMMKIARKQSELRIRERRKEEMLLACRPEAIQETFLKIAERNRLPYEFGK